MPIAQSFERGNFKMFGQAEMFCDLPSCLEGFVLQINEDKTIFFVRVRV